MLVVDKTYTVRSVFTKVERRNRTSGANSQKFELTLRGGDFRCLSHSYEANNVITGIQSHFPRKLGTPKPDSANSAGRQASSAPPSHQWSAETIKAAELINAGRKAGSNAVDKHSRLEACLCLLLWLASG